MAHIAFSPEQDLMLAFPTPIVRVPLLEAEAINPELKAAILQQEREGSEMSRSNRGGWQSKDDLLAWPVPAIKVLAEAIYEAVTQVQTTVCDFKGRQFDLSMKAWANICREGAYHARHNHGVSHWSGVYYVDAGGTNEDWPMSGILEFGDPRERAECSALPGAAYGESLAYPPRTGTMTIFPGWLYHWVNPYHGAEERISISFNASFRNVRAL